MTAQTASSSHAIKSSWPQAASSQANLRCLASRVQGDLSIGGHRHAPLHQRCQVGTQQLRGALQDIDEQVKHIQSELLILTLHRVQPHLQHMYTDWDMEANTGEASLPELPGSQSSPLAARCTEAPPARHASNSRGV